MDAGALAQWRSHASAQTNGEGGAAYVNGECVCVFKDALQRHYLWLFISLSFSFLFFVPGSELNATFTSRSEFH